MSGEQHCPLCGAPGYDGEFCANCNYEPMSAEQNAIEGLSEGERTCANHGDTILWEDGGPDMPTPLGRWYCPTCDQVFMDVMNAIDRRDR